jgi:hypothetical protein
MAAVLALLAIAFVSLLAHLNRMLYGVAPEGIHRGEVRGWAMVPLVACVAMLLVLGVVMPAPMTELLDKIAEIAGR